MCWTLCVDVDNVASETSADKCCSKLFTVHSLTGHNGIVTAVAMSSSVLVTARCVIHLLVIKCVITDNIIWF